MRAEIVPFEPGWAQDCWMVLFLAVRRLENYSAAEKKAWAPGPFAPDEWEARLTDGWTRVLVERGQVLGFVTFIEDQIELLYVRPERQRQGWGRLLIQTAEQEAQARGFRAIHTQASLASRPLFLAQGYHDVQPLPCVRSGLTLSAYWMEKAI